LGAVFGATLPTVAVKDSVVGDLNLVVQVQELLDVREVVLHVVTLTDVSFHSFVITLDQEFQAANSERVSWLKVITFAIKQHPVEATTLLRFEI
jgi:hypothetical protein